MALEFDDGGREFPIYPKCGHRFRETMTFERAFAEAVLDSLLQTAYPAEFKVVGRCQECLTTLVGAPTMNEFRFLAEIVSRDGDGLALLRLARTILGAKKNAYQVDPYFPLPGKVDP